ncbi:MAG TPA: alpha/beta fold hydrolase, partial [Dehalococcoidia bacterium]
MTPSIRHAALVVVLALAGFILYSGTARAAAEGLDWHACGVFQCATLTVPLDYDHPEGRQIDLSVVRQPARDQSQRIGSLFVNPGGPGGSAVDFLRAWAPTLAPDIRDRFDVITFDPRGVGESTPLECHDNIQQLAALPPAPGSDAEWQEIADADKSFADLCAERAGGTLPYLGTVNVARDIDRLREALGEDKISYFGYSYGTEMGQVYAGLFPQRVRAMVLDGAVDLALSGDQVDFEQAMAFEKAYDHFLQDCESRSCLDVPGDYGQ